MEVVDDETGADEEKPQTGDHNVLTSDLRVGFHQGRQTSASHHHTSLIPGSFRLVCVWVLLFVVVVVVVDVVVVVVVDHHVIGLCIIASGRNPGSF